MKGILIIISLAALLCISACGKQETSVIIDGSSVNGDYTFVEGLFSVSIGSGREIQTGAAVITFSYEGDSYRVEIPTDAIVTKINLTEAMLSSSGENVVTYNTKTSGSDTRWSRIKKL